MYEIRTSVLNVGTPLNNERMRVSSINIEDRNTQEKKKMIEVKRRRQNYKEARS